MLMTMRSSSTASGSSCQSPPTTVCSATSAGTLLDAGSSWSRSSPQAAPLAGVVVSLIAVLPALVRTLVGRRNDGALVLDVDTTERIVLAQRVPIPVVGHVQ